MDVSLQLSISVKSLIRIKKPLVVSAILLAFTFGAIAMSLAYESSDGSLNTALSKHSSGDGLLGADSVAQRFALLCLSGDVPRTTQPNFQSYRISQFRVVDPVSMAVFLESHVSKVSLQILQSVLLI